MPRLKRQGIDFFILHTDYLHSLALRRIMKREGEGAVAVLLETYAAIYSGEGYYVKAGPEFMESLADQFFRLEAEDVERVLTLAIKNELFDGEMYRRYQILTSATIQSEFLYATRRRANREIDERYNLLPATAETDENEPEDVSAGKPEMSTGTHETETFNAEKSVEAYPGTQTTQHNTTQQETKEKPLLKGSPQTGGTGDAGRKPAEERKEDDSLGKGAAPHVPRQWTLEDVERLQPPQDGLERNLEGLKINLKQFRIPPKEQYAIILKSNYGVIGHPVWKGFYQLRGSYGKIHSPARYLLSLCVPDKKG